MNLEQNRQKPLCKGHSLNSRQMAMYQTVRKGVYCNRIQQSKQLYHCYVLFKAQVFLPKVISFATSELLCVTAV